ncbi:MAG TPA: radical SAM protein [Bacteroidia bacterium]|nr:radical SAM protein [Bacteroidia bacterium]
MALLFREVVFGPVKSRRFGRSLGINLLPLENKLCNFNCVYCECGWTDLKTQHASYTPKKELLQIISSEFERISSNGLEIDRITFAGNGEPTMHPAFEEILYKVADLRDQYFPGKNIVVLSNGALLGKSGIYQALLKADERVLKLDAGNQDLFSRINGPLSHKNLNWYIDRLKAFEGKLSIQTLFLKGLVNGLSVDNSTDVAVNDWLNCLSIIRPSSVMLYTLDRETPAEDLHKVSLSRLNEIALKVKDLGMEAKVYG